MIFAVVGGDCLPCSISYCILVSGSESWTLVTAEHIRSTEDLHDCLALFFSRSQNSLDFELWQSGDVEVVQQIPQSTGGDWGFIFGTLDLIGVMVLLFLVGVTQRSVVFIVFAFSHIAFFFFILMVIVMAIILRQLLSFLHFFSCWYRDHDLKEVLLLRRIGLRRRLRWHIPWHQLTSGMMSSALAGCVARTNHLKFGNRREQDNNLNKINELKTRMKLKL
jgi:hypothetical protein